MAKKDAFDLSALVDRKPKSDGPPRSGGLTEPHVPNDERRTFVRVMVATGLTRRQIALALGIDGKTLYKHYAEDMERGHPYMLARVGGALYRTATGPASSHQVTAAIFILKCQAGWRTTDKQEAGLPPVAAEADTDGTAKRIVMEKLSGIRARLRAGLSPEDVGT